uniref:Reverse transcriptase domain-containing protein n=1 Tax=Tanacetum cinerariifolium TaxID=118510 RepID=A0A6L2LDT9_TANCI|nr:reverse transcriptase domain-containing protein [Tanacetum cinerariifolium]
MRDPLKCNDEEMFDRLGHRRQSAFDRLSNTYSPTKSGPNEGNPRDRSHSRKRSRRRSSSSRDCPRNRNRPRGIKESYGNTRSSYMEGDRHGYHARNRNCSRSMKRGKESKSPLSRVSESDTIDEGHWKTRAKRREPADEEDLSVPWTCEDVDPFTPRICNFKSSRKTRISNNVKTYEGTGDPEDHLKIFQAAAQVERWPMPTRCHMFNSTLIGAVRVWFDELPPESIDGYKGLKAAFLSYFMQQKKYVKDPVEIHNIKHRDRETIKEFMERKFKPPPPMVTLVEKRSSNKFCEFHNDKGHSTDESTPKDPAKKAEARHKIFKVAIHPDFLDQEITIGGARLVDKAFDRQIGWNLEIYVDDLVIKSHTEKELLWDIDETFRTLRKIDMKLNPKKSPKPKEELIMYLFASYEVISAVLMTERDTVQTPVYFVSRALQAPELNYTPIEKLVLALVCTAKRLRRYFQAHPIVVITDQPIKQILANFLVEKLEDALHEASVIETPQEPWTLFTNGSSCVDGSGVGLILTSPEGTEFTYALRFQFTASNNEAEYEALIVGLRIATQMGALVLEAIAKVPNAMRSGYNWPTMHWDAREMIRKCKDCLIHRPVPRHPQQPLTPITTSWPFYKWGIDIAGPFPEGPRKGIVTDNDKKFSGDPFKDWCEKLNIVQHFVSVKHPQSNGLVERANRSLGEGIKARLGEGNNNWLEELPHVLWAHRTMIKSSNKDTPFSLTCGTEAIIPAEIKIPIYRTMVVDTVHNDEELRLNLDLLEERHEREAIHEAKAKLKMTKYYNARVRGVTFRPIDCVYRSNDTNHVVDGRKLGPKWEGLYEVRKALGDGAYKLRSTDETVLPRT